MLLVAFLTCFSQVQFCTYLFWDVAFYSYQRLSYHTILVSLPHLLLIDHSQVRLSDGALRCVG